MKKITLLAMSFIMALTVMAQNTGKDVTSLFTNTDFETGDNSGWTYDEDGIGAGHAATAANYGYQGVHFMEAWTGSGGTLSDFNWYQTIEVPNGHYVVTALAHAVRQNQGDNTPVSEGVFVYANNVEVEVKCTKESPDEYMLSVEVTEGKLTIGYRAEDCNVNWVACDYFQVTQCFGTTEEELQVSYGKCEMTKIVDRLNVLVDNPMSAELRDNIYAAAEEIEGITTLAACDELLALFVGYEEEAEACVVAYEDLILKIEEVYAKADEADDADMLYEAADAAQEKYDEESMSAAEAIAEITALDQAVYDYNMSLITGDEGFDVTALYVTNPSWRTSASKAGWDIVVERKMNWGDFPAFGTDLAEVYQCDFNISQTLTNIPNGKYRVRVQAFYRGGTLTAELYANNDAVKLLPLEKYSTADFGSVSGANAAGYADNLTSASAAFNTLNPVTGRNFYDENELDVIVMDGTLTFGIRSYTTDMGTWCAYRDFQLYYYGNFPYINLLGKINTIRDYLFENEEDIPSAIWFEVDEFMQEAEDNGYTEEGEYSDDEVNAVISALDAKWHEALEAIELFAELKAAVANAEENLLPLEFPGADDLWDLVNEGNEYFELDCETNTYEVLLDFEARLNEGITAYLFSQEATPENPADYTFLVPNPNFEQKGEWTWSVEGGGSDQWIGNCRPSEEGGASRRGINLWGWGITSVDVHQVLTGLPNGLYKVSAELITQNDYATDQHVYATGAATVVSDYLTVTGWDTYEWTTLTTNDYAVVVDGTLTIGAASSQGGTNSEAWFQATNFKLYYYGKASGEAMKAAWDELLGQANEAVDCLIPNEKAALTAAIAEATAIAEAGSYDEACMALSPVLADWADEVEATKAFYGGYYAKLDTIRNYDAYEGCEWVYDFADATIVLADAILVSDTATHNCFADLDNKIHAYANYAAALRDAERAVKSGEYSEKNTKAFTEGVVDAQDKTLRAALCEAEVTDALTAELRKMLAIYVQSNNMDLEVEEGDVTYLLANPTVETKEGEDLAGWTIVKNNAVNCGTNSNEHYSGVTNAYLDAWNGTAGAMNSTFYQELHGIPDGTYRLTAAARTDGSNAYIFASITEDVKAETTKFAEVKKYSAFKGEIWEADSLEWVAAGSPTVEELGDELTELYPYFMARPNDETGYGQGFGWSWHVIEEIEVINHYLFIGLSADRDFHGQKKFNGTWMGADDWKLELVKISDVQSEYDPFATGIENVEVAAPVMKGIYDLFGRRIDAITAPGLYIVNGKKVLVK